MYYVCSKYAIIFVQVSGAYSKTWSFREDTLLAVYKLLQQLPLDTSKEDLRTNVKAALFLINRSVKG